MKIYKLSELTTAETPIHIFSVETHEASKLHMHDFIEIIYVRDGSGTENVNGETFEVRRGDLLFINVNSTHEFIPHGEGLSYTNICLCPEVVGEKLITPENAFAMLQLTAFDELRLDSDTGITAFSGAERDGIERILDTMLAEYRTRQPSWKTVMESCMNILMIRLLRRFRFAGTDGCEDTTWRELRDYIDRNLGADLTLSALAGKCFYNPSYFSRIFKERFGVPLTEYVNRRRVEHAIDLLTSTALPCESVAEQVGFSSKSSFYRVFTRVTGKTPSDYREKSKKIRP